MEFQTHTITLRSKQHYGKRVPPRALGEILRTFPVLVRQSVRMAFEGRSKAPGVRPSWLSHASDVRFVDHQGEDDTILYFEIPTIGEAAHELYKQQEIWTTRPEPEDTGIDLLADVISDVSANRRDSERFDQPLLQQLHKLNRGLNGTFQEFLLTCRRYSSDQPAVVNQSVLTNAEDLTRSTPRPRQVRIAGTLDMIRASTNAFAIKLESGKEVKGVLTQGHATRLRDLFEKRVAVMGKAIYRPSGSLLRVDAVEVRSMQPEDNFFTTIPEACTEGIDMRQVQQQQKRKRGVAAIIGRWPGDESDEHIETILQELS